MGDQGSDDDQVAQRMDALLLKLLKTPPQSRAELAEQVRRAKGRRLLGFAAIAPAQESAEALLSRSRLGEAVGTGAACPLLRRSRRLPFSIRHVARVGAEIELG